MKKYTVEIGGIVDTIEADSAEQAVRMAYEPALNRDQIDTLEIEGNAWSGAEWDAAVTDDDGNKDYFFVSWDQDA